MSGKNTGKESNTLVLLSILGYPYTTMLVIVSVPAFAYNLK